ncbi:hypothetical protein PYCC9005_003946 [Savitreella phatthalungensis]
MELDSDMYADGAGSTDAATDVRPQSALRENALHLRGVDELSTKQVLAYVTHWTSTVPRQAEQIKTDESKPEADTDLADAPLVSRLDVEPTSDETPGLKARPRVEWIDDTSLNLVYYTPEEARQAFTLLAGETYSEEARLLEQATSGVSIAARPLQSNSVDGDTVRDSRLAIRFATTSDVKTAGAKDRSRYYLFHPEADPDTRIRNGDGRRGGGGRGGDRRNDPYGRDARRRRDHRARSRSRSPPPRDGRGGLFDRLGPKPLLSRLGDKREEREPVYGRLGSRDPGRAPRS